MSKNSKELRNAEKIIERFGGIRPMASKIDVPVTTVQGWKKRDVIPGTRRQLILEAANVNDIDISDLVSETKTVSGNISDFKKRDDKSSESTPITQDNSREDSAPLKPEDRASAYEPLEGIKSSEDLLAEIEASEKKAFTKSLWTSLGVTVLVLGAAAALLWPGAKDVKEQVTQNTEQIEGLETNVADLDTNVQDVQEKTGFLQNIVPEDMQAKFEGLQNQARNLQNTFAQIGQGGNAKMADRISDLENKIAELSSGGFEGVMARIESLEQTLQGQQQLDGAITELRTIVDNLDGKVNSLSEGIDGMPENTALGQTLEGVNGTDLKAAAMLIAFSQLRDSLNREAPFEDDLILLQKLAGEDNTELQGALMKLAPHADGGVLTSEGLSNEFKGLAGDIVAASVSGEDVSIADKAKARLNDMLQVEKDGEVINGSDTQIAVSQAQKLLDQGDIDGAIKVLNSLEGDAAQTAQPFIDQAQASALAQQLQTMLRQTILSNISAPAVGNLPAVNNLQSLGTRAIDLEVITESIENALPGRQVVTDEESGVTILPKQQGFKGLSNTTP